LCKRKTQTSVYALGQFEQDNSGERSICFNKETIAVTKVLAAECEIKNLLQSSKLYSLYRQTS
jgi:hypothetical protein